MVILKLFYGCLVLNIQLERENTTHSIVKLKMKNRRGVN